MTLADSSAPNMSTSSSPAPLFSIEKLYVRDASLEVPGAPECFFNMPAPEIQLEVQTGAQKINDHLYDVLLHIHLRAQAGEKTIFLVELAQAGLFRLQHVPDDEVAPILGIACPNMLLPFAREAVCDAVIRAGFPPVLLTPMNFEALYRARLEQVSAQAQPSGKPASTAP
jgi:preprotein translocase subunit SecB